MHTAPTLSQTAKGAIEHARQSTASHLTSTLHQYAHEAGWPADVYRGLSVQHSDETGFGVHVADHLQDDAYDLEFGTSSTPPNAVMRQFTNRIHGFADEPAVAALSAMTEGWL